MKFRNFLFLFLFILALSVGFAAGLLTSQATALTDKIYQELEIFTRIIEVVDNQYVQSIDEKKLVEGAIRGMLEALDPYTIYLPAEMYKDFKSETTGKF